MNEKMLEKAGGYVSKLVFNDGESVEIKKNDIVLFVGPNNAGKSQSLKDIYDLSRTRCPTTVVSDIDIHKYSGSLKHTLNHISTGQNQGKYTQYQVMGGDVIVFDHTEHSFFPIHILRILDRYLLLTLIHLHDYRSVGHRKALIEIHPSSIRFTTPLLIQHIENGSVIASRKHLGQIWFPIHSSVQQSPSAWENLLSS